MGSRSYVLGVLRALHAAAPGALDAQAILAALPRMEGSPIVPNWEDDATAVYAIAELLEELRAIGVVGQIEGNEWVLSTAVDGDQATHAPGPPAPPVPPRGDGDRGGSGNGGGSGVGEVLAHELLFSLSKADFQSAVDHALSGQG